MSGIIGESVRAAMAVLVISLMCWCAPANAAADDAAIDPQQGQTLLAGSSGEAQSIDVAIPVGAYGITNTRQGQEVSVDGYGSLLEPGKPKLPSKIFAIAIPPGADVDGIDYDLGTGVVLPGTYEIRPAPLPRVIGREDPALRERDLQRYEQDFRQAYESDDAYPASAVEFVRTAGYRRYNLADVRVTPLQYHPVSGRLVYYPNISVGVRYWLSGQPRSVMVDSLPRTERVAEEIVLNYEQAGAWYAAPRGGDRGLHDFVIITLDSLASSVTSLVNWETAKGRNVDVVTTSWISTNYPGGYDLAENMRNFLRDKYPSGEWGIEDVLLVGDYDDVPMRRTWQDRGYGKPETDFYYAELSQPDSQSWDDDGDHRYGENSDPIDFYAEVNVGRIPWSTPSTVQSICNKSVAYEQNTDPAFKNNILLLGTYFWEDTDNAELMEAKVDQTWMSDWTMTRMYEKNSTVYSAFPCDYDISHANVMSVWSSGQFAFVNWAGHGSPTSAHMMGYSSQAFIQSSDCYSLNDSYPAVIFADACSNSDTGSSNIGRAMLNRGAVGFVGATKVAYGCPGWNDPYDGSSQSLDYFFTTYVTSGDYTQGEALQRALREMYTNGLWYYLKYETFEWGALWGNPALGIFAEAVGACCHADPFCTMDTEENCTATDGTYSGDGTDCSPNPCIPDTGACCYSDGSCAYLLHSVCDTAGGTYQGDLVECDPTPCPQPTGGCCHLDGSCTIDTAAACDTAGGAYEGDDTTCDPNPCPPPTGACCHADESCTIEMAADCGTAGGTYWGDFTTCDPTPCPQVRGACCLPPLYIDCIFVTAVGCDGFGGSYRGDDVPCLPTDPCPPPTGACCHPDGSCAEEPQAVCVAGGGLYQGDGTECTPNPCPAPTGGCCHSDGSCTTVTAAQCASAGGAYQGDGTACDPNPCPQPWGACCYSGGSCIEGSPTDCSAAGGVYDGNGTTCTPNSCEQACPGPFVLGDMNGDDDVNGGDIQGFVDAIMRGSREAVDVCPADFDDSLIVDLGDLPGMVAALLE